MKSVLGLLALAAQCAFVVSHNVTIGSMKYVGPITPGGKDVTLYGTAEGIHEQIRTLNPAFNPDDFDVVRNARAQRLTRRDLVARTRDGISCTPDAPYNVVGPVGGVDTGIDYLNSLPGTCGAAAFTGSEMTCNSGGAVWFIDNTSNNIAVQCQYTAEMAEDAVDACQSGGYVNGQESDTAGFVVLVCAC